MLKSRLCGRKRDQDGWFFGSRFGETATQPNTPAPYRAPISVSPSPRSIEGKRRAQQSLRYGIASTIAWIFPIVGVPVSIASIVYGFLGLGKKKRKEAVIGIALGMVFLIVSIGTWIVGYYLYINGTIPFLPPP
jgi:hypothetical protein